MPHPNTFAAVTSFLLVQGIVWLLGHYGINLSEHQKAALDGGVPAAVLFIGRDGIKGAIGAVWNGSKTAWSGPAAKK